LRRIYERLTRSDLPTAADLIFVHAGRMERKQYGIELYRSGIAPRLILSVGRFEISKMAAMGFEGAAELIAQRDRAAPGDRHFFCEMSGSGIGIEKVRLRSWDTYGELLALRDFLKCNMPGNLLIVSTDVHLRRVALTFQKVFGGVPNAKFCPVPVSKSSLIKDSWWSKPENRNFVLKESIKLAGYRTILAMPERVGLAIFQMKESFYRGLF
jgi:hypothetical protein